MVPQAFIVVYKKYLFYSKIPCLLFPAPPMPLTDDQWALIAPLFPPPSSSLRGRPPLDERLILDAILYKLASGLPWYDLTIRDLSWQTCYRRYRLWQRLGLLSRIYHLLYLDLCARGGFDVIQALHQGQLALQHENGRLRLEYPPELAGRWQGYTALLLYGYILHAGRKPPPSPASFPPSQTGESDQPSPSPLS